MERWFEVNDPPDHQRDGIYLKVVLSFATGLADTRKIISRERAMLYQELHRATARRSEVDPERELSLILLLDKTVMHLEADLRWLDMLEARLDEIKRPADRGAGPAAEGQAEKSADNRHRYGQYG